MPPRGKTKAPVKPKAAEVDYTTYADKAPTDLQERFAAWIPEATEYDPAAAKTKQAAFEAGVRLATALRMHFQASPENQEVLAERRAGVEAKKAAPKGAPAKRGRKAKAEVEAEEPEPEELEEDEAEEDEEPEETPAPKRTTRARKATAGATKAKGGRRKAAQGADAPF